MRDMFEHPGGQALCALLFLYYGLTPSPVSSFQSTVAADVYRSADILYSKGLLPEEVYYRNSKIRWNSIMHASLIKRYWPWTRTVDSHNFWKPLCFSCRLRKALDFLKVQRGLKKQAIGLKIVAETSREAMSLHSWFSALGSRVQQLRRHGDKIFAQLVLAIQCRSSCIVTYQDMTAFLRAYKPPYQNHYLYTGKANKILCQAV